MILTKIFDLHCDTISLICEHGKLLFNNDFHIDLKRGLEFDTWVQTFAFFIPDEYIKNGALSYFKKLYNYFLKEYKANENLLSNYAKTKKLIKNKCNFLLSVEGGSMLEGNIDNIQHLVDTNIKIFTLTWNNENEIAGGVNSNAGLSNFGKKVVSSLQKNDIIVDVSHLNDKSFYDVASMSKKSIIASHSNARKICNHKRNLSDEQIKYIIDNKGLIGLNFFTYFISGEDKCTIDQMCNHIEYILSLGGEHTLCLGSDFDGADVSKEIFDIKGVEIFYHNVIKYFKKDIADKIFFQNANRFFKNIL